MAFILIDLRCSVQVDIPEPVISCRHQRLAIASKIDADDGPAFRVEPFAVTSLDCGNQGKSTVGDIVNQAFSVNDSSHLHAGYLRLTSLSPSVENFTAVTMQ